MAGAIPPGNTFEIPFSSRSDKGWWMGMGGGLVLVAVDVALLRAEAAPTATSTRPPHPPNPSPCRYAWGETSSTFKRIDASGRLA